jgi:hypothetical protein
MPSRNEADLEDVPEELRKGMTFVPVDRVEEVWEAAMGLRLDGRGAELAEANDLLEEAGELLQRARHKAGERRGAEAEAAAASGAPAGKAPAKKAPARKAPAKAKAPPPRAKGGAKKTTAVRGRSGRKK